MDDMQANPPPETGEKGRRSGRIAGDAVPIGRDGEPRSFAPEALQTVGHEGVDAARDLSKAAADTAREVGERSREATREAVNSWRGAMDPFLSMQLELNRWFDDLWRQASGFGGLPSLRTARPFGALSAASMFGLPPIDMKETAEAYQLCAELPGLSREDVDLQVRGDVLILSGHKTEQKDEAAFDYRVSERRFGRFERRFPVPPDVDRSRLEAGFRDGVLTVILPKTADAAQQGEKIAIKD